MSAPSLVASGLRGRVERLLRGEIIQDDLRELFFHMREEAGGRGTVSEIAHFFAHPTVRTQGIVTDEVRDFSTYFKAMSPFFNQRIITMDLPASILDAFRANFRRVRTTTLKRQTGLNRGRAMTVLEKVLSRSTLTAPGRVRKIDTRTAEEERVVLCVAKNIKGGSLFNDNDLFEDFCRGLIKRGILQPLEKPVLKNSKAAISLFALVAMHDRTIDLGDGTTATLSIFPDIRKNLATFAEFRAADYSGPWPSRIRAWIFETNLPIASYCEPGVAPLQRDAFIGQFALTSGTKLGRVA